VLGRAEPPEDASVGPARSVGGRFARKVTGSGSPCAGLKDSWQERGLPRVASPTNSPGRRIVRGPVLRHALLMAAVVIVPPTWPDPRAHPFGWIDVPVEPGGTDFGERKEACSSRRRRAALPSLLVRVALPPAEVQRRIAWVGRFVARGLTYVEGGSEFHRRRHRAATPESLFAQVVVRVRQVGSRAAAQCVGGGSASSSRAVAARRDLVACSSVVRALRGGSCAA
jgi:hypothetical protein